MTIIELVKYFRQGGSYEEFCQNQLLDTESEVIEVYMSKPFDIKKPLQFFEIEKTGGTVEFIQDGISYFNLFDLYYFMDTIEESNTGTNKDLTDGKLSEIVFNYAINDA